MRNPLIVGECLGTNRYVIEPPLIISGFVIGGYLEEQ